MKNFDFPLEKVRLYREKRAQLEESKLERLYAGRRAVELRRETLNQHRAETEKSLLSATSVNAAELGALDRWGRFVEQQTQIFAKQIAQCDTEIAAQRARVMEARRQFQLLDKLKEKRLAVWRAECDRELEQQAAESYLAQWSKEKGLVESG
jgi:hypothetical protein